MSIREKIIIALMVVAVIYGAYVMLFPSPEQTKAHDTGADRELQVLNGFITKIADKTNSGQSKRQVYILKKAQEDWKKDPLVRLEAKKVIATGPEEVPDARIKYTGFLQMGDTRLAIISGIEYEAGDRLESGGYIVRRILPDYVVVVPPGNSKKFFILPMQESE